MRQAPRLRVRHRRLFVLIRVGCTMRSGIPDDRDSDGQWKRAEKQARSIKYQLTVAKLPLAKDVDDAAGAVSREMEFAI
jgi:hypothetical protein